MFLTAKNYWPFWECVDRKNLPNKGLFHFRCCDEQDALADRRRGVQFAHGTEAKAQKKRTSRYRGYNFSAR